MGWSGNSRRRQRDEPCPKCGAEVNSSCRTVGTWPDSKMVIRPGSGDRRFVELDEPRQPGMRAYKMHMILLTPVQEKKPRPVLVECLSCGRISKLRMKDGVCTSQAECAKRAKRRARNEWDPIGEHNMGKVREGHAADSSPYKASSVWRQRR